MRVERERERFRERERWSCAHSLSCHCSQRLCASCRARGALPALCPHTPPCHLHACAHSEISGPDQSYLSHIMKETRAKLLVVGRGAPQHQDIADGLVVYIGASELQPVQDAVRSEPLPILPRHTQKPTHYLCLYLLVSLFVCVSTLKHSLPDACTHAHTNECMYGDGK